MAIRTSCLTDAAREKLRGPNFAFLAELMQDGSPHVTPVWCDLEEDRVLINTAIGRLKERNMRRDDRVALSIADVDDPYDHVDIRGRVVETIEGEEAEAHIHALGRKYRGWDRYPLQEGERRVKIVIEPIVCC